MHYKSKTIIILKVNNGNATKLLAGKTMAAFLVQAKLILNNVNYTS